MSVSMKCPAKPEHGPVLPIANNPQWGWYCPNRDHDGRPRVEPKTRAFFTTAEVTAGRLAP